MFFLSLFKYISLLLLEDEKKSLYLWPSLLLLFCLLRWRDPLPLKQDLLLLALPPLKLNENYNHILR